MKNGKEAQQSGTRCVMCTEAFETIYIFRNNLECGAVHIFLFLENSEKSVIVITSASCKYSVKLSSNKYYEQLMVNNFNCMQAEICCYLCVLFNVEVTEVFCSKQKLT
jgi:hypothetical protein